MLKENMKKKNELSLTQSQLLKVFVEELIKKHSCHTVVLYGSRARGDATEHSDYDLMGVRKSGKKYRIARKQYGYHLDGFVFPEKDLKKIDENHLYMNGAKVLYQKNKFGTIFLKRLKAAFNKKHKPLPADEIQVRRVWLHKMFDRVKVGDIEALYRRSWLHEALLYEYFAIRKKRYLGSKKSFSWLKKNKPDVYRLFERVLKKPQDLLILKKLVEKVSGLKSSDLEL